MKIFQGVEILENLCEIVNPSHTALVIWDVQNALVNRIFNQAEFLAAMRKLLEAMRGRMPLVYTLITPLPPAFRSGWNYQSMMKLHGVDDPSKIPMFLTPGTEGYQVPEIIRPQPGDLQIEKATPNIFLGTNVERMMHNRGIKTMIFTGIATEVGVEHSARDAAARGFYPVVVTDCVSSMNQGAHQRSLANMDRLAILASSAEILKAIHEAPQP